MEMNQIMAEDRLVVILRGVPADMLCDVLDAMNDEGVRLAEITYDTAGRIPAEETAAMIANAVKHTEGRMLIGAGTVLTERQLELTKEAGGRFIISPHTDASLIRRTKELGLVSIPGSQTVSEIVTAMNAGADYIKLFPVSALGPSFVKNVMAPLNTAKLLAVSGANPTNIPDYLAAGCVGFGVGSGIVTPKLCAEGRLDVIAANARTYVKACHV
ncbi:MAG: bifunctional 4-hydroxy-2-oxoglutarate aldolase/2-dehydro-3-deoxy-phosphogluconate aldolase [Clostridia bacterium]|nr:bifunctional 4-hydroxy-2-oxoglutarate aldolase/2-dehydro-3-deoxy-phosphogluconate aldolase [Clostridia bacterium]